MGLDFTRSKNSILKDVVKKNTEESNSKIIKNIPLEDIEENPVNEQIFNMDGIEQLADTIKKEGFSGSIEVIALGNGKYQIYSGHRRYRAVRSLGYPTIPCTIEEKPSETLLMRKLLSSNIQTRKMLPLDYARAIAEYEKILKAEGFKGDKRAEIARFFNTSGGQIYRYMAISKMIPRLQVMTNEPEFPYTAFLDANKFNKSQQELLADKIDYYREQHPELGIPRVVIQQFCKEIEQETDREQKLKENIKKGAEKTVDKVAADNKEEFLNVGFMSAVSSEEPEKKEEKLPSEIKRERIAESRQSIDFEVIRTARTLSLNTSKDFTISNKESVEQAIREIESALEVLKDKIR
jgi:ParB family chromosome partitioning protein